jgi:copper chaperone CopZ
MKKTRGITINVSGMTCSHCEATVKKHLEALNGIEEVQADNKSGTVQISGSRIDLEKVKDTISGLGYQFLD